MGSAVDGVTMVGPGDGVDGDVVTTPDGRGSDSRKCRAKGEVVMVSSRNVYKGGGVVVMEWKGKVVSLKIT